jgi:uncharacterized protein DUF1579
MTSRSRTSSIAALAVLALLSLAAAVAHAQMPKPAPEMAKLKFLQGNWTYESTYEKGAFYPNGANTKGTYVAIEGPGGFSQIADFHEMAPEGEEIGHEVTNWDDANHVYKSYVFGNAFPQCVMRTGHWDGNKLIFVTDFEQGTMKMTLQSVTTANPDGTITIQESMRGADGSWKLLFTSHAKRAS